MSDNTPVISPSAGARVKQNQKAWRYLRTIAGMSNETLNRLAIRDGVHDYTYGLMFREWERYASVFSALGMTQENAARVGILGSDATEVIFACYGLNMVGAQVSILSSLSSLRTERVMNTIRDEAITDFIVTDDLAQPNLVTELLARKDELGLRNVILLHVTVGGPAVNKALVVAHETKYRYLKSWFAPICMDTLLARHGNHPVRYAPDEVDDAAFIIHTSGTTSGMGKPIPLSDRAFNAVGTCFFKLQGYDVLPWDDPVCGVAVDLSNAYGIVNQVHLPLAMGATLVVVPGGILNPSFHKAIPEFGMTLLFCVSAMIEHWISMSSCDRLDLASLRCIVMGGAAVSARDKRRYHEFLAEHGAGDVALLNGYGISELGGACCLSSTDLDDESIGHLLPGFDLRLYDEDAERFLRPKDLPAEGVLYLSSPTVATPTLDGREVVEAEALARKPFVSTNDLVRVDEDGRITYLGRANRFFVGEDGVKYESGRVETEISRQSGIESCGIVPFYHKWTHQTLPMLCVKTLDDSAPATDVVREALLQAFKVEKTLEEHNIPQRVMIVAELPRNANGKVDLHQISQGAVSGETYEVRVKRLLDQVVDFKLVPLKEEESDMIKVALGAIAQDMKDSIPFIGKDSKEGNGMNQNMNPLNAFNAMNQMGSQAMGMLFSMGQHAQQPQGAQAQQAQPQMPFCPMPQMPFPQMPQVQLPQIPVAEVLAGMTQMNLMAMQMMQQMCLSNYQLMGQMIQLYQQNMGIAQEEDGQAASGEDAD